MNKKIALEVRNCARCHKDHIHILVDFNLFTNPPSYADYWGMCPETGEPILLKAEVI